jgi:Sulfotransferase family
LVPEWLATYRWARQQFAIRALPFFRDEDELRVFYRRFLGEFLSHCRDRFGRDAALVLKSPELSLFCQEAVEIFPDARFLATIRDPRDQIASEWRVVERRQGSPEDLRILRERDFGMLARQYVHYYEPILAVLDRDPGRIHIQEYEQLVTRPREALTDLEAFTGLDLQGFDPQSAWPRVADTFWGFTSPSDTPHYGQAIEPRRVGSYTESMSEEEARGVEAACAHVTSRLVKRS